MYAKNQGCLRLPGLLAPEKLSSEVKFENFSFENLTNATSKWSSWCQLFKNVNYICNSSHSRSLKIEKSEKGACLNTSVLKNISLWTQACFEIIVCFSDICNFSNFALWPLPVTLNRKNDPKMSFLFFFHF